MNVDTERPGPGQIRLRIEEEMTIYTAAGLKSELQRALAEGAELEIDLSRVAEMDSAGFQLILGLKREAARLGKSLRLVSHSPAVIEVLDTFNMVNYFGDPVVIPSGKPQGKAV